MRRAKEPPKANGEEKKDSSKSSSDTDSEKGILGPFNKHGGGKAVRNWLKPFHQILT